MLYTGPRTSVHKPLVLDFHFFFLLSQVSEALRYVKAWVSNQMSWKNINMCHESSSLVLSQ